MAVILSSETGAAARAPERAPDPTSGVERLAISRPSSAPAAPTCRPAGADPFVRALRPPGPSPRAPAVFAAELDPGKSGVPAPPGFPLGVAANVPRRLPAGTATDRKSTRLNSSHLG